MQAYFLLEKLKKLKSDTNERQKLAKIYDKKCDELGLQYLPSNKNYQNSYHIYLVVVKNRNSLKKKLFKKGIGTKIHYEIPIHLQTAFKHLNYKKGDLPVTEYLSKNILSLPFYPGIEKEKLIIYLNL